jgi:AcrR family transcriptional regulator
VAETWRITSTTELLWGLRMPGRRGPKAGLVLDDIAAAALRLADEEGLDAVSMARLSQRLNRSPMALYRYVRGKEELLELMADAALGEAPRTPSDMPWQQRLRKWAEDALAALRRHAWYAEIPILAPPIGPRNLAWFESGLQALDHTRLSEADKVDIVLTVITVVHGTIRMTVAGPGPDAAPMRPSYGEQLRAVVDAEKLPAVHAAVAQGVFDQIAGPPAAGRETGFVAGLQLIIAGVETQLRHQAPGDLS